jgi:predicted enzyme related to lactoylglutathione lyase
LGKTTIRVTEHDRGAPRIDRHPSVDQADGMETEVLFAAVAVSDLGRAVGWYRRFFGREPDVAPNDDERMWRVADGGWLYVVRDAARSGHSVVTIAVGDLAHAVAELASREVVEAPIQAIGTAGRKAILVDPEGNEIALIEVFAPPAT